MTVPHVLLKYGTKSKFLKWLNLSFSGAMGTRHTRVTYLQHPKSRRLGVQIKCDKIGFIFYSQQSNFALSKKFNTTLPSNSVKPDHKKYTIPTVQIDSSEVYEEFKDESCSLILNDIVRCLWESTSNLSVDKYRTLDFKEILSSYGFLRNQGLKKEQLIVEFGSPNIAKPLHMGHLRSMVTGNYVARICKAANHEVKNYCFLGDFGKQFGILQAGLQHWMPEEDVVKSVEQLDLKSLLKYYVDAVKETENNSEFAKTAHECSAALERGDDNAVRIWDTIRNKTVNHLEKFWSLFNIYYDVMQGESEFTIKNHHTEKILNQLEKKNLIEIDSDGCMYAVIPPEEKMTHGMKIPIIKADGSTLYLTRDLACAVDRIENIKFDRMLYVVDKTQSNHFILLFYLLDKLGWQLNTDSTDKWEHKVRHVTFGKVEGMSTRSGNFVLLSDVIEEGSSIMQENRVDSKNTRLQEDESIATRLALSALIVNSLKVRRNRDIKFDWKETLRSTGETGIRLQYTHARLCSLESKLSTHFSIDASKVPDEFNCEYVLEDPIALDLALHLANFEDSFWASYSELEPCILLTYMFRLCDKSSKALKELKVQTEPDRSIALSRYILFCLARRILTYSMNVIGVNQLSEM